MATTADIKNGSVIIHKSKRMKIVEFQHVKPGKGGAFVRTKLKDIKSGKTISTLKIDKDKISRPFVSNQNLYLAKDNAIIKLN